MSDGDSTEFGGRGDASAPPPAELTPSCPLPSSKMFRLTSDLIFPPPHLSHPDGLLAVGGDLSVERLLLAYRMGIFPWYSPGDPILWWSPDPRMVLFPAELHVSRRLNRVIKMGVFEVRMDSAFADVIENCGEVRNAKRRGTWITSEMRRAYCRLHEAGYAHSAEAWQEGQLVGGLYGVSIGSCFFGESMYSLVPNASKVAFVALVRQLAQWEFSLIDCQMHTEHLARFGAREIPRTEFLALLERGLRAETRLGRWG